MSGLIDTALLIMVCNILFFLYPKLDNDFIWMFPGQKKVDKEMDMFLDMLDDIIRNKKLMTENNIKMMQWKITKEIY